MYSANGSQPEVRELAEQLYTDKYRYLLSIARRNAVNEADAEEALQEAFANFIRAFDASSEAPPLAWLTLTLKRQCWRQRREAHLERQVGQEAERGAQELGSVIESIPSRAAGPEQRVLGRVDARARLVALKPDQRTALGQLAAGYSYKEIAARRGWTYTKVNRCISEGRAALRAE
jgi:RNA polymerase sigma factor (sigma-70 family)